MSILRSAAFWILAVDLAFFPMVANEVWIWSIQRNVNFGRLLNAEARAHERHQSRTATSNNPEVTRGTKCAHNLLWERANRQVGSERERICRLAATGILPVDINQYR